MALYLDREKSKIRSIIFNHQPYISQRPSRKVYAHRNRNSWWPGAILPPDVSRDSLAKATPRFQTHAHPGPKKSPFSVESELWAKLFTQVGIEHLSGYTSCSPVWRARIALHAPWGVRVRRPHPHRSHTPSARLESSEVLRFHLSQDLATKGCTVPDNRPRFLLKYSVENWRTCDNERICGLAG